MSPTTYKRPPGLARAAPWVGVLVIATTLSVAPATARAGAGPRAARSAVAGVVYGGVTPQRWPVVVEVSRNRRQVVGANVGLDLKCTSGDSFSDTDSFIKLRINKRRFSSTSGPITTRNPDGSTTDFADSVRGTANAAGTKMSGTWELTETFFNAGGAVTDTCKSGTVRWTAKQ